MIRKTISEFARHTLRAVVVNDNVPFIIHDPDDISAAPSSATLKSCTRLAHTILSAGRSIGLQTSTRLIGRQSARLAVGAFRHDRKWRRVSWLLQVVRLFG